MNGSEIAPASAAQDGGITVRLSQKCFEREAVIAAAYDLSGEATVILGDLNDGFWAVQLQPRQDTTTKTAVLAGWLHDIAVDHQLRLDLDKRFGSLREQIYQQAFSAAESAETRKKR